MISFERPRYAIVIVGPAGSGKSTMCDAFSTWLNNNGFRAEIINLDPGTEYIPYRPMWDIRTKIKIEKIMKDKKLGPNGAMIAAMDLLTEKIDDYLREILTINTDYLLIDTPGQIEIFAFRDVGAKFIEKINQYITTLGLFLLDGLFVKDVVSFIVAQLLATAVELNLAIPFVPIINKGDLFDKNILEKLTRQQNLKRILIQERRGAIMDLVLPIAKTISKIKLPARTVVTSALLKSGMNELFDILHELFCTCGDLT